MAGATLPASMSSESATRSAEFSDDISGRSFCFVNGPTRIDLNVEPFPVGFASHDDQPAGWCERPPEGGQLAVAAGVDDCVVSHLPVEKAALGVVDHVVYSERPDHADLARAAHPGDLSACCAGDLGGKRPDPAGCPDDQDLLAGLDPDLADGLQGGDPGDGGGCRLGKGQVLRPGGQLSGLDRGKLGEETQSAGR